MPFVALVVGEPNPEEPCSLENCMLPPPPPLPCPALLLGPQDPSFFLMT